MKTEKEIVLELSALRKQLNFERSWPQFLRHILEDGLLLTFSLWAYFQFQPTLYIFSQFGFVVFFFRSFGLMHEAVHFNIVNSKRVNAFAGIFYGAFCFLPYLNWRSIHLQHHLWAGNVDRDPSMQLVNSIPLYSKFKLHFANILWRIWFPYLAIMQHYVFWKESLKLLKENPQSLKLWSSLIPPLGFIVGLGLLSGAGPWLGVLPAIYLYMVMVEVVNFPHHLGLPYEYKNKRLSYLSQYKVARSCHYGPILSRVVFMNFNYHVEHHLYPNLPWHQLGHAAKLVQPSLGTSRYNFEEGHSWILRSKTQDLPTVLRRGEDKVPEVARTSA